MSALRLHAVRKSFHDVVALDGVDLAVEAGQRAAIVGPSGSGKSTLLRVIAGFEAPDSGRVELDGEVVAEGADIVPAHRRGIGLVAQDGALFPHLSVADNIGFGLARGAPDRASRIRDLLAMVDLDSAMLGRRPDQLSGGQQQRVALARALARRPRLMLLDEPFSALDTGLRATTRRTVERVLAAAGITTILVTHDQEEALAFADQVAVMRAGGLPQTGTPRQLYLHPVDVMVAEFLGEAIILPARLEPGWATCALGRIPVAGGEEGGAGTIMLRPEQVSLAAARGRGELEGDGCVGEVAASAFGGATCRVRVRLHARDAVAGRDIDLRLPYLAAPSLGTIVRVTIAGEAHLFPGTVST